MKLLWTLSGRSMAFVAALGLLYACANLPSEESYTGESLTGNPNPGVVQLATATSTDGVAIRWHNDPTKCIARKQKTATVGDTLTLALCANDNRQAWSCTYGLCLGALGRSMGTRASTGGAVTVENDFNLIVFVRSGPGSAQINNAMTGAGIGFLSPSDSTGPLDNDIIVSPASTANASYTHWDVTGVGSTVRGTTLALDGGSEFCLMKQGTSVTLAACDVTNAAQRWTLINGALACDAGQYLTLDRTQTPASVVMADAVETVGNSSGTWTLFSLGWQYGLSAANGNTLFLMGDGNTLKVSATTGAYGSNFLFGGHLEAQ